MKVGVRDASGRFLRSFDVIVKLPWDSVITLIVQHDMTVADLQSLIEVSSGVPCELLELSLLSKHRLDETLTLRELRVIQGLQFKVSLPSTYGSLILATVKGNSKAVLGEIERFKNESKNGFAKGMALFISAHKGYHHLVEKLLSAKADPNFKTRSLRTPLHAACATGNIACVGTLLQFGASHDFKDINGQTPSQVAFSCGHREIQQRIQMIKNSKSRQERFAGLKTSWSKSPRFPVSRLARSVSPVIALRELAIQPGPELTVTSFQDSKDATSYPKDIESESESDDHLSNDGNSDESFKHDGRFLSQRGNVLASSRSRHVRPKTAPPRTASRNTDIASRQSSSVIDSETRDRVPVSLTTSNGTTSNALVSCRESLYEHKARSITTHDRTKRSPYFAYSAKAPSVLKMSDRLWVMNSNRERLLQNSKRQVGMTRPSTAPLTKRRQPATVEENDRAFQEWLEFKMQGAKDDKMIKCVSAMIDEAFGRKKEVPSREEKVSSQSSRKGMSFEEWRKKKNLEARIKSGGVVNVQGKETEGNHVDSNKQDRLKTCSVSQWYEEKKKEEMKQKSWKNKKKKFNRVYQERRTQQAEIAFNKWRLQKEWEELERLT